MKRFLASVIAVFTNLLLSGLKSGRRNDTRHMIRDQLLPVHSVRTKKGQLVFESNSRKSSRRVSSLHSDEPDTILWLDTLPANSCLWDIGANIGIYSLYAALEPTVHVLSFEPSGSNYAALNRNIELSQLSDRITAFCMAFADNSRIGHLNMTNTETGRAMHGFETRVNQFEETLHIRYRQGTIAFSIDDFVSLFSPPLPTHVKIDVDGIEASILRGGKDTLSARSVKSMIIEVQGRPDSSRQQEILSIMSELGFTARRKQSCRFRNVIFDRLPK